MVFGEGCGSGRGEFDMLMQENAVRRRKRGGGGAEFEGRQGGIIRKMALARDEAAWSGPGKTKACVCPCTSVFVRTSFSLRP